jgi:hypothetical protein
MLQVKTSTIPNAGKGLFATVDIPKRTKLGEYKGKRLSEQQFQRTADTSYVWKVSARGKNVYVDARRKVVNNPLRYVNGAISKRQKKKVNVEMYQYGQKVFYRTTKKVPAGTELIIDYGDEYILHGGSSKYCMQKKKEKIM